MAEQEPPSEAKQDAPADEGAAKAEPTEAPQAQEAPAAPPPDPETPEPQAPAEAPKAEAPAKAAKAEAPAKAPKAEAPAEAPKAEAPAEAPKAEAPVKAAKAKAAKAKAPKTEAPEGEAPAKAPEGETPEGEAPAEAPEATPEVEAEPAPVIAPLPEGKHYIWGMGRRKKAVARVRIRPGTGKFFVNKREAKDYFNHDRDREAIGAPLRIARMARSWDVWVNVKGGGYTGQAGAVVLGLARALSKALPEVEGALRDQGFMTRDARMSERKKPGQPGARKRFQFSKR